MQVKIGGKNINYEVIGEGNPVVLLHGWLTDLETMRPLAENLSKNFKCYLVDIIGFGKSELPDNPMHSDDFGNFLFELLKNLNIENPILIGHSNGGRTIINAVGRELFPCRKIVLIDSAGIVPKRSTSYYIKITISKIGKRIINIIPNNNLKEKLRNKLLSKMGSEDYKNSPEVLKETMKNILNEDQKKYLPKIKAPTLLIWGSIDRATPIEDARIMKNMIPDCGLVEYPNSTHFSYLENINQVNIVLNNFLNHDISKPSIHN